MIQAGGGGTRHEEIGFFCANCVILNSIYSIRDQVCSLMLLIVMTSLYKYVSLQFNDNIT